MSAPQEQLPEAHLLNLPTELRDRIRKFPVTEPDLIYITKKLKPPAMTQVCSQLRSETRQLWYTSKKFQVDILNSDGVLALKWRDHSLKLLWPSESMHTIHLAKGRSKESHLKLWLRAC